MKKLKNLSLFFAISSLSLAACTNNNNNNSYVFKTPAGADFSQTPIQNLTPTGLTNLKVSYGGDGNMIVTCTSGYKLLGGTVPTEGQQIGYICNNPDGCIIQSLTLNYNINDLVNHNTAMAVNINEQDPVTYGEETGLFNNEVVAGTGFMLTSAACIPPNTQSDWVDGP